MIHQLYAGSRLDPEGQGQDPDNTKACREIVILIQVKNCAGGGCSNNQKQGNKGRDRFHNARFRYVKE
jgi:hypothetical protein